jgi:hypothetical protein
MFLISIADQAGPSVNMHRTMRKGKKKAKRHTHAENKSRCKTEVLLWSLLTYLVVH